jgi:hypothetical protein
MTEPMAMNQWADSPMMGYHGLSRHISDDQDTLGCQLPTLELSIDPPSLGSPNLEQFRLDL